MMEKEVKNILEVSRFSINYPVSYYNVSSFREAFVNAISSPLELLLKEQDKIIILNNINFSLEQGEKLGLIGNNGSGKSSLCRNIAGLYGANRLIKIRGKVRGIFDTEVAIFPELTGHENLKILCQLIFHDFNRKERELIVKETEDFCDLGKFLHMPFKYYSKGMRARLFLSLISARTSDLLILDEVFNGADYFFSEKMSHRIKKTIEESGAVIFVSHSFDLISEICNRVIVLDNSRIVFDGNVPDGIKYYRENCEATLIQNA